MRDRTPTVRSRELGEGIRKAIREAGMRPNAVSRQLGWSTGRISRIIYGKRGGSAIDVASILAICRVTGEERDRLIALSHERELPNWLQIPSDVRTLINHEKEAAAIIEFEFNVIPGLLQTEAYTQALLTGVGTLPEQQINHLARVRLNRQHLLVRPNPPAPAFTFFIHEFALRLPVGESEVMSQQLHHLLQMSVRGNLSLRVIPASKGAHAGINGSFRFMEFTRIRPVVYLETEASSVFLEAELAIDAYRVILSKLEEAALSEGQSRELIGSVAVDLYPDGQDHDVSEGPRMA